ncbi:hypothetical protein QFC24_000833 [Naganishia onofrii]|uniref:Uncharacterized protein n=1 Tax=Naganishia onofrii TaxID=1851511 RepID=A0ACC2XVP2_9TREE|nr:hypothetical protein QFC24_000833 [Naganishia onofrii]
MQYSKISLYPEIAAAAVKAQQTVNSDERRVEDDLADSLEDVGRTKQQQEGVVPAEVESVTEVQVQVVQEFVRDVNEEEELMNEEEEMMNEEEAMNEEEYYGNEGDDDDGEEEEFEDEDENDDDDEEDDENGQVDEEKYFFEPEQPKHRGQEPTLPLIAAFSQWRLHKTLAYLDTWISETLDIVSAELTSTTETDEINPAAPLSNSTAAAATPLTPRYARWIFSCLLFLDEYLSADQMSDLRNLAKTCVKIVIWQVATGRVGPDGQGVDERQEEMRVNAWIVHRAICGGWAQHDLLQDAESMLGQLA